MKFVIFLAVCAVAVNAGRIAPPSTSLLPPFLPSGTPIRHYPTIPLAYRNPLGYRSPLLGYRGSHILSPFSSYPYSFGSPLNSLSYASYAPLAPVYRSSSSLLNSFGGIHGGFSSLG